MPKPLIVGAADDEHVAAVVACLADRSVTASIGDAAAPGGLVDDAPWSATRPAEPVPRRGWIRRLAPPHWIRGVRLDSHDAVVRNAWMSLLTGAVLTAECQWLTPLPDLISAENKLNQLAAARALGIQVPATVVASSVDDIRALGGAASLVVKPLGPAAFVDEEGVDRVVAAQRISLDELSDELVGAAPFLFQSEVVGAAHLRVVTVGDQAWTAALVIDSTLPLDWRFDDAAHDSFVPAREPELQSMALRLAQRLNAGYSSQDWVLVDGNRYVFLDFNPAGQWLFLPPAIADPVTEAIAAFLAGGLE